MKSIIPALILAIAILWGLYLLADANRYEVSVSSSVAMRIDRRTGNTWLWGGSRAEGGWYAVGGPAEGRDRSRTIFDDIEDDIEAGRIDPEGK